MKIITSLAALATFTTVVACNVETASPSDEDSDRDRDKNGESAAPPAAIRANDPMNASPTPAAGKAIVRVIHGSADAPSVDVYARGEGKPLVTGLMYGQTSGWLEVPPGTYEFELRAAPSKPSDPIAYKTNALAIPAGAKISAIAAGLLSSQDPESAFRVVPVVEGFGAKSAGAARLRVVHAGSDAPSVDLDVGNDDPASPEVAGLVRFADTGAAGVSLPSGKALAIGIASGGERVTAFTTPKLPDGGEIIVIATGLLGKLARERDGFALLAIGGNGSIGFVKQDPRVYALHGSPDAPRVDIFAGAAEIASNVAFGQLSGPIQVQPGNYTLDIFAATAGTARPAAAPALSAETGQLEAGERYLTVAEGFISGTGASALRLAAYKEGFALGTGKAQLRAIHASPDAPEVDIGLSATGTKIDPVLFGGLSFSQASSLEGLGAAAGHLPIGVTPANQNTSVVARVTLAATNEQRAFVLAGGALNSSRGQSFRFFVVDTATAPWTLSTVFPH